MCVCELVADVNLPADSPAVASELDQAAFPESTPSSRTPPGSQNKVQVDPLLASARGVITSRTRPRLWASPHFKDQLPCCEVCPLCHVTG